MKKARVDRAVTVNRERCAKKVLGERRDRVAKREAKEDRGVKRG